jgi:hypothetical protein
MGGGGGGMKTFGKEELSPSIYELLTSSSMEFPSRFVSKYHLNSKVLKETRNYSLF